MPKMAPGTRLATMIFTIVCLTVMERKEGLRPASEPLRFITIVFIGRSTLAVASSGAALLSFTTTHGADLRLLMRWFFNSIGLLQTIPHWAQHQATTNGT